MLTADGLFRAMLGAGLEPVEKKSQTGWRVECVVGAWTEAAEGRTRDEAFQLLIDNCPALRRRLGIKGGGRAAT